MEAVKWLGQSLRRPASIVRLMIVRALWRGVGLTASRQGTNQAGQSPSSAHSACQKPANIEAQPDSEFSCLFKNQGSSSSKATQV